MTDNRDATKSSYKQEMQKRLAKQVNLRLPIRCVLLSALATSTRFTLGPSVATNRETHSATAESSLKLRRSQRHTDRLRVHACCLWPRVHVCVAIHGLLFYSLSRSD